MKVIKKQNQHQKGQTIVEVLIATAVVAMVLTTVMSTMVLSLKNTSQAKYKALATKLAQEGMEAFRRNRDNLGWQSFREVLLSQGSQTYCINTLPVTIDQFANLSEGNCATTMNYVGIGFRRHATYVIDSADQVTVTISVVWNDGSLSRQTEIVQQFKNWR